MTFVREICIRENDIDSYLQGLSFVSVSLEVYGVGSINMLEEIAFGDNDLNCTNLISSLVRMILHKCD